MNSEARFASENVREQKKHICSIRSPDPSRSDPFTYRKNFASRKIEPNIPKNLNSEARFASENVRDRKNPIGSIGDGDRSSQRTKAATKASPTTIEPTISTLP